ncbi:hypothetical protein ACQEU5_15265 [Marinactinospora thermotolerans]|uniref:Uncharacterized protein n=1 Tax=Marinactinospora thermotolerans DSM 45154 TaxID=1122192 RepID=A0A1T4RKG4_9ACTN|nr:hypothetical protein [Marinactinospora thermotolerans]SKA16419.1 hypothetical protein SAMN02745673_02763 [Marinactinospora thermotolerans DSM 45154]
MRIIQRAAVIGLLAAPMAVGAVGAASAGIGGGGSLYHTSFAFAGPKGAYSAYLIAASGGIGGVGGSLYSQGFSYAGPDGAYNAELNAVAGPRPRF